MPEPDPGVHNAATSARYAVDIGSTVVKVARLNQEGELLTQEFFARDYEAGIAKQVGALLARLHVDTGSDDVLVCSSANGGLRVGIICLTQHFSGATLRNQTLLAGANPVFVHELDEADGDLRRVDILLVGGGIDTESSEPMATRLHKFNPANYTYGALVFAGNRFLAERFKARFPQTKVIENPLGTSLSTRVGSAFEAVRRAYLDDLTYKEGISELHGNLARGVRPTPEVASRGFLRAVLNKSTFQIVGACLALDIGGATTDLHYTVEIVRDDSEVKPAGGLSVARYVFTDLGIFASRDTLLLQLRSHARLYEFLATVQPEHVRETYARLREGEFDPCPEVLSYACLFIALDRFAQGRGPGLPAASLEKVAQIVLTGGAAQTLTESVAQRVAGLLLPDSSPLPVLQIDRRYQMWVDGITWTGDAPARS